MTPLTYPLSSQGSSSATVGATGVETKQLDYVAHTCVYSSRLEKFTVNELLDKHLSED
jgi:hypothetical protein